MEMIKIILVEEGKPAREIEIEHTLDKMQELVGGYIQARYPWKDPVALVCDDEGLYKYPFNRCVKDTIIAGTFFICGLTEENFGSLSDDLVQKYKRMFAEPESFFRTKNALVCVNRHGIKKAIPIR